MTVSRICTPGKTTSGWWFVLLAAACAMCFNAPIIADEPAPQELADSFKPDQSKLPAPPPDGAIVLYDGRGTNRFLSREGKAIDWAEEDGALVSTRKQQRSNHIVSQLHFRDADIHAEFQVASGGEGNSGIYIHGNYELQIFNSFGKENPTHHDHGAIYGFAAPRVNASRPVGEWQVYDIRYRAPRRDAEGKIVEEGAITAWLNGELVHHNARFGEPRSVYHPYRYNTTPYLQAIWKRQLSTGAGPVFLQDHDSPARFRNVWVKPLDDRAFMYEPKK